MILEKFYPSKTLGIYFKISLTTSRIMDMLINDSFAFFVLYEGEPDLRYYNLFEDH